MGHWSQHFEEAYQIVLPDDVRAWLDDEVWREPLGAEFCQPLQPEQLLSPGHNEIWAGFMLPDTLPLIGNDYGDWLCLRVGRESQVDEVIRWSHAGGDWLPLGKTLSEALVFDAALRLIHDRRPEFTELELPADQLYGAAAWAIQQSKLDVPKFWEDDHWEEHDAGVSLFETLVNANVAVTPSCCQLILAFLDSPLKSKSVPATASHFEVPWEPDFVRWMFDGSLLPESIRDTLTTHWKLSPEELVRQDWDAAERFALQVANQRDDLAWPFEIAGWAAERREAWGEAAELYHRSLRTSVFTDDSIRFRTQWRPESFAKFSAFRLHALQEAVPDVVGKSAAPAAPSESSEIDGYLNELWHGETSSLKTRVAAHWMSQADSAEDPWERYTALGRAGWDLGLENLQDYPSLLEQLKVAAKDAGATGLACIAATHRAAF